MYNAKAVIIGIVIAVVVFTAPFWASFLGQEYTRTGISLPIEQKACVESTEFMRNKHMQLLNEWRDEALRNENRVYVASNGKNWAISLQNTCLKCHTDYKGFCNKCHVANSVDPYCWTCHLIPQGSTK